MRKFQGCDKQLASLQSLLNHKQRCKGYAQIGDHDKESPIGEKRKVFGSFRRLSAQKTLSSRDQIGSYALNSSPAAQCIDSSDVSSMGEMNKDEIH